MKGKKCFGLLLLLSIMVGLSLSVFSEDTSALLHDVKYIPISSDTAYQSGTNTSYYSQNPSFRIQWTNTSYYPTDSIRSDKLRFFTSRLLNNRCTYVNNQDHYYTTPSYSSGIFTFSFTSYRFNYGNNSNTGLCQQTVPFGTLYQNQSNLFSHPNFDESSLVNIPFTDQSYYRALLPYYYDYDSFYIHDSATDTSTGITYNNTLKMSNVVGFIPNKFSQLTIPLGRANEDVVGVITENRHVDYHGVFDFSGEGNSVTFSQDFVDNGTFRLNYVGLTEQQSVSGTTSNTYGYTDCSVNNITLPANGFNQLEFDCSFDSPVTFYNGQVWFWLQISSSNGSYIFDTNADWSFSSAYFMTDNDSTPGGTWGTAPTGNNLSKAPGSAQALLPSDDSDWFSSLTNLFGFTFINPFSPLFSLFTDQSECASIPTLAGMLNSNESTYCPWFSSTTRGILTPVLSIASIMLIFGFVVRWLSSSSGNMFEDQTTHKWGNTQFKQGGK